MQSSRFALQSIVLAAFVSLALFFSCSSDDAVSSHTHDASDINAGTLANARLNTGVDFHYTVNGVRKGYENFEPITDSAKLLKKLDQADAQERGK